MTFSSPSESAGCPARLLPTKSNTKAADKAPSQDLPPGCDQARLNVSRDSWRSLAKECFESAFCMAADGMPCQRGLCDANLHMLRQCFKAGHCINVQTGVSQSQASKANMGLQAAMNFCGHLDDAAFVTRSAFVQSALGIWLIAVELDISLAMIPTYAATGTCTCHVTNSSWSRACLLILCHWLNQQQAPQLWQPQMRCFPQSFWNLLRQSGDALQAVVHALH